MELTQIPPGVYRGVVTGPESGRCTARIEVRAAPGGCVTVDYESASDAFGVQHVEHTVVSDAALYVAFVEGRGVTEFRRSGPDAYVAENGMRIVAGVADGVLTWAWHWGASPGEVREQSTASRPLDGG